MRRDTIQPMPTPQGLVGATADRLVALGVALLVLVTGGLYAQWLHPVQWDADEGIMLMTARLVGQGYRLYTDIWCDQPPGIFLSLLVAFRLFGESVEVGRAVTLSYGLLGMLSVAWLAYQLSQTAGLGRAGAFSAPLLLALTPNFFWLTRTVQHDIPPLSVTILALCLTLRYIQTGQRRWLLGAGLLLGWAFWLKQTVVLLALPLVGFMALGVWDAAKRASPIGSEARRSPPRSKTLTLAFSQGERGHLLREAVRASGALIGGGVLALAPLALLYDIPAFVRQVVGTPIIARTVWPDRSAEYASWIVEYLRDENLGLTALAALGLLALLHYAPRYGLVMLGWLVVTVIAIVTQRPLYALHHFSLLFYPLVVLGGVGVAAAWTGLTRPRQAVGLAGLSVAALAVALWFAPRQATLLQEAVEPSAYRSLAYAAEWIASQTQPDDFVLTDPPMIAFRADRNQIPWLVYQSSKRIETEQLPVDQAIAMTEHYQPAAIALWTGRLDRLDAYITWLSQRYAVVERDEDRVLMLPLERVIQHPQPARLGDTIELLGYDLAVQGREVTLTLYWRSLAPTPINYTVFNHMLGADGKGYGQHDGPPDEGRAMTSTWTPGQIIADQHVMTIAPNAPPDLRIHVGLYDSKTGERLPVVEGGRQLDGAQLILSTPINAE